MPADTKTWAAIAIGTLLMCVLQTNRIVQVTVRAMQNPKVMPDITNFCPLRLLTWNIVMCTAARVMKMTRNMEVIYRKSGVSNHLLHMRYGVCAPETKTSFAHSIWEILCTYWVVEARCRRASKGCHCGRVWSMLLS